MQFEEKEKHLERKNHWGRSATIADSYVLPRQCQLQGPFTSQQCAFRRKSIKLNPTLKVEPY